MFDEILRVLIASVIMFVWGSLAYSKLLFGEAWIKASGINPNEMNMSGSQMALTMLQGFIASVGFVLVYSTFVSIVDATSFMDIAFIGFLLFAFYALVRLRNVSYEGNYKLYFINLTIFTVDLFIATIVFSLF
jgi:hypothetical protein